MEEHEVREPGPEMGLEIRDLLGNIPGIYILQYNSSPSFVSKNRVFFVDKKMEAFFQNFIKFSNE